MARCMNSLWCFDLTRLTLPLLGGIVSDILYPWLECNLDVRSCLVSCLNQSWVFSRCIILFFNSGFASPHLLTLSSYFSSVCFYQDHPALTKHCNNGALHRLDCELHLGVYTHRRLSGYTVCHQTISRGHHQTTSGYEPCSLDVCLSGVPSIRAK
jgi:hypothetical protein